MFHKYPYLVIFSLLTRMYLFILISLWDQLNIIIQMTLLHHSHFILIIKCLQIMLPFEHFHQHISFILIINLNLQ